MSGPLGMLMEGLAVAAAPQNLALALGGAVLGTAVGVLPGLGPAMSISLLLPVTFGLAPTSALILLAGIYYGAMYGGSTTSILLNVPGESSTIVTAIEGHAMARRGRAGAALATAALGSFVAGVITTVVLALTGPWLANAALRFGPPEYFALAMIAFSAVVAVTSQSLARALVSLFVGMVIGMVGIDTQSGEARFTFGIPQLLDGIDIVVVAIALFAVSETLWLAWRGDDKLPAQAVVPTGRLVLTRDDWRRSWPAWLRGTAIGFPLGALPIGGAELPTFLSYGVERRLSKHPEEFGEGAIEGVAGPEAANNASAAGTMVPLLALGVPTTATAAVLLAAFQQFGLRPGPLLFEQQVTVVWGLIASFLIGNVMLVALNLPLVRVWARLASLPPSALYAGIMIVATVSAYTIHHSLVDVILLYVLAALGFALRLAKLPVVPVVIGALLGPVAEQHLQRSLTISDGSWLIFLTRPWAATILALALAITTGALLRARR